MSSAGTCEPRFAFLRELFDARLSGGDEVGAAVCVIQDDVVRADLWGGVADVATGAPWTRDTLVNTYSLTKTMTALVALALIDRGVLDPDEPVARYWPGFRARDVLVRHVLGHTSGLSGWDEPLVLADLYDTARTAGLLAAQEPWWPPGDGSGYHAVTFGTLVGELVRRVTGRSLGTVLREEFAGPAGADYWLGTPASADPRIATLVPPPASDLDLSGLDPQSVAARTLLNPLIAPSATKDRAFLAAELGGFNGQGNARSVARLQAIVSHGGTFEGRRYLSPAGVESAFSEQSDGVDRVLFVDVRFGLGYGLPGSSVLPALPEGRICWWTGLGGSVVVNDLDRRLTFAYVMNGMAPGLVGVLNSQEWVEALYSCLDG